MPDLPSLPLPDLQAIDRVCLRFEETWQSGPPPALEDYLGEVSATARPVLLRQLLELELDYRRRAGQTPTAAEYLARFPGQEPVVQAVFQRSGPPTVPFERGQANAALSLGQQVTYVPAVEPEKPAEHTVQVSPRYAVREQVGQGGLGKVHRARDLHLGREVAIKEMLAPVPGSEREERFLVEAQVTGQLEHPGVVPVYDLGRKADGSLFYAMKLLRGRTLSAAIQEFHRLAADDAERPVRLTQLLTAFVGVCNAVAFAHSRGVLHRDLKPANIMLGDFGEAQVIDWGLARALEQQSPPPGADPQVWVEAGGRLRAGERGLVVGTLGYMAPEQAEAADDIDPRADVWALGAILRELLTGHPPLRIPANLQRNEARRWLLEQINGGQVPRPRSLRPWIPRPLEAVCLKAMTADRRGRYGDARELALEVERWLAGEPVLAYPEPFWDRARRWVKRHRTLTTTATAVLLVGLVSVGLWRWREGRRIDEARTVVDAARRQARSHAERGEAVHAREELLRGLAVLEREPALDELKPEIQELLDEAESRLAAERLRVAERQRLADFRRLRDEALLQGALLDTPNSEQRGLDTAALAEQALTRAGYQSGRGPQFVAGLFTAAEEAEVREGCRLLLFAQAEAAALPPRRDPTEALRLLEQARSTQEEYVYHQRRARYLRQADRDKEADEAQRSADRLASRTPLDHRLAAEEWMAQGQFEKARQELRAAQRLDPARFETLYLLAACELRLKRWSQAAALLTGCAALRPDFVGVYVLRGLAYGELNELPQAQADFAQALRLNPNEGGAYLNRGFVLLRHDKFQDALADFQQAARRWPSDPSPLLNQAEAYRRLGRYDDAATALGQALTLSGGAWGRPHLQQARLWLERDRLDEAAKSLDEALKVSPAGSLLWAQVQAEMGRLRHRQKRFPEARQHYTQALSARPDYAEARRLLAETLAEMGDPAQAITHLEDYLDDSGLRQEGWTVRRRELGLVYREMALAELQLRHYDRGVQTAALAEHLLQREKLSQPYDRHRLATLHARAGWFYLVDQDRAALASSHFDRAVDLSSEVKDNGDAYAGRAFALAVQGKHIEAAKAAEEAVARGPADVVLVNAACAYSRASREALADTALEQDAAVERAQKYAARALALLDRAVQGVKEEKRGAWLKRYVLADAAFDPLRQSRAFNDFLLKYLR